MEVFEGHQALFRPLMEAAITIGNFDGVHRGHQELLRRAACAAQKLGGDAVAMTFEPHPVAFLCPAKVPSRLTTVARKLELFADANMSAAVVEAFDASFASLSAREFEDRILGKTLAAKHVVVGHDFAYGSGKTGDIQSLRRAGERLGFCVEEVKPILRGTVRVSSSEVRKALVTGDMSAATALLGRSYDVDGVVVRGAGRGRKFGVATANLDTAGILLPRPGIYATRVQILGEKGRNYLAATSLGTNPTFVEGGALTLEAHLLDFDANLYDKSLRITFLQWLRGEERYDDLDSLLAQIRVDIQDTRNIGKERNIL